MIPVISGTSAGQYVASGQNIDPFANVSITDGNDYIHNTQLTISVLDGNGQPTDANGTLSIPSDGGSISGSEVSAGVYVLTDSSDPSPTRGLAHFQPLLGEMQFIPSGAGTSTFTLAVIDSDNEHISDSNTTVISQGSGSATQPDTSVVAAAPTTLQSSADTSTTSDTSSPAAASPNDVTISTRIGYGTIETVSDDSILTLAHSRSFRGEVALNSGVVDLNGLANADSYSFKADILSIYNGGTLLGKLTLTTDSSAFSVQTDKTGTVSIYTADDTRHLSGSVLTNIS